MVFLVVLNCTCARFFVSNGPRYQVMVPEGRQKAVCKGVFGMLMLDTATMSSLSLMEVGWRHGNLYVVPRHFRLHLQL